MNEVEKLNKKLDKAVNLLSDADNEINELKRVIKITYDLCSKIKYPTENELKKLCFNTIKNDYNL